MRLLPRSLFGRLLATAGVALAIALAAAGIAIGNILAHVVMHGMDERLDAQLAVVERAVRPDGTLDPVKAVDVPPFDRAGSGWAWEVRTPGGTLRSASLDGGDIVPGEAPPPPPRGPPHHDRDRAQPFEAIDETGREVHGRMRAIPTAAGIAQVIATGPRDVTERPLHAAMTPLLLSLLLLGVALAGALLVQLRIGLRPLAHLRAMVADVRAGRRERIVADEPTELLPLVAELNALIDANQAALAQARGHVANLAHGLKTPLAAMRLDLGEANRDPDGRIIAQVDRMDSQIRHHLGRARAATPAGAARAATPLAPHVIDLVAALTRIHAERAVSADMIVPGDLMVLCDPQDLDEMVGNLLDNAWRYAATVVRVVAVRAERRILLAIEDDGPGLPPADLARISEAGRRLDEREGGHGFGLAIATELAQLHGGTLTLGTTPGGGVRATLSLAAAG